MKKIVFIVAFLILGSNFLHGEESVEPTQEVHEQFNYFSVGGGFPLLLNLEFGSRVQHNHHGFEGGIGVGSIIALNDVHLFGSYLFYPTPNPQDQLYFGLSVQPGYAFIESGHLKIDKKEF